jgi:hypothetical protein
MDGQVNLRDANRRTIVFDAPNGKQYRLRPDNELATLLVRGTADAAAAAGCAGCGASSGSGVLLVGSSALVHAACCLANDRLLCSCSCVPRCCQSYNGLSRSYDGPSRGVD